MKVLITGVNGFIGSELARKLVSQKNVSVGVLLRTASNQNRMDIVNDIVKDLSVFYANFTDYHAVRNAVRAFSPNYIVHLGAQTAVRNSFENPHEFNETNFLGTMNLIHAALEIPGFKKFIFASTMEVYGWQKQRRPFKEGLELKPGSPYAVSKVNCEQYIKMAANAFGLPYLISRACNTFGRKHNTGFIVEYIITSMLAGKDVYIGTPRAKRDLMYVDDHVNAYLALLKTPLTNQVFNFGVGNAISMLELANILKKKIGFKGKIIPRFPPDYPWRPSTEEYLSIDASRAKKLLHWQPRYSSDEGLDKTIAFWRAQMKDV